MKRQMYVIVDETQNIIIGCEAMATEKALMNTLNAALQKQSLDVDISVYRLCSVELTDDNRVVFYPSDNSEGIIAAKVWQYPQTEQSDTVNSDVLNDEEVR